MQLRLHRIVGFLVLFSSVGMRVDAADPKERTYQPPTLKRTVVQPAQPQRLRGAASESPLVFENVQGGKATPPVVSRTPQRGVTPAANIVVGEETPAAVPEMAYPTIVTEGPYPAYPGDSCSCGEPVCGCDASCGIELSCGCDGPVCGCDAPLMLDGCDAMHPAGDVCFDGGCDSGLFGTRDCGCGSCALCIFDLVCIDVRIPTRNLYGSAEAILWWQRGENLPALVTTSDAGTAAADLGVLGLATTTTLFGGERTDSEAELGGRLTIGRWLDSRRCRALEFRYWGAGEQDFDFATTSNETPIIARPFFSIDTNQDAAQVIANTDSAATTGSIAVHGESDMYGYDLLIRRHLSTAMNGRIDWLWGYQTSKLDSVLSIDTVTGGGPTVNDTFATENEFHGAAFGIRSLHRHRRWSFGTQFKIAFGGLRRSVLLSGSSTVGNANEGLLVRASNSGNTSDSTFAVLPEVNLTLGYRIRKNLDLTFGYNYLMMNNVVQPWRTIDPAVDFAGGTRPSRIATDGPFWLQGLTFGLASKY